MAAMQQLIKRALITGGARRLGAAMARAVAREGFDVVIHCHRSADAARNLAGEIEAMGRRAAVVVADLAHEDEAARVMPEARDAIGPIGVLVNNASVFELDHLATADRASWDRHMETNLRAPIVLSQGFVRQLPADAKGLIVNLLDQRVMNLTPNFLSYSVSRMGLWAATQVLARELAPRVRVNAIGPGPTLPAPGMSQARFDELWRGTPLQHGATPEEIGSALRFIIESPSMTGQMITLDGGQQLGWLTPEAPNVD
jgi:NAD(P)-dependent dehydrogenase (short-subunit alcohol dehydrogenase family)